MIKPFLLVSALLLACSCSYSRAASPVDVMPQRAPALTDTGARQCFAGSTKNPGEMVSADCGSVAALSLSDSQDGMIGHSLVNTKAGFSYQRLTPACVQDNVTGLVWETNGQVAGLRREFTNLGRSQEGDVSLLVDRANQERWCGFSDWRLPTILELQSLVDYGVTPPGPVLDSQWFPDAQPRAYWSATTYVPDAYNQKWYGQAWVLYFSDGSIAKYGTYLSLPARLVRGNAPAPGPRFEVTMDGQEVIDQDTHLIWRRCVAGSELHNGVCTEAPYMSYSLPKAFAYARAEAARTHKPWRLPNIKELSGLAARNRSPAFDPTVFPATPTNQYMWSSTPAQAAVKPYDEYQSGSIWYVNFNDGSLIRDYPHEHSLRLVRDPDVERVMQ